MNDITFEVGDIVELINNDNYYIKNGNKTKILQLSSLGVIESDHMVKLNKIYSIIWFTDSNNHISSLCFAKRLKLKYSKYSDEVKMLNI